MLSVVSVCVDMVEVVGKELCLVCALGGRWWRRFGWLASGLISGGWVSVSWFVGWLVVGGGWAVGAVESAESAGAIGSAAVDARALGL